MCNFCKNKKWKHFWFVFKWFFIGKFHCDCGVKSKFAFKILHYILILTILLSIAYSLGSLTQYILEKNNLIFYDNSTPVTRLVNQIVK